MFLRARLSVRGSNNATSLSLSAVRFKKELHQIKERTASEATRGGPGTIRRRRWSGARRARSTCAVFKLLHLLTSWPTLISFRPLRTGQLNKRHVCRPSRLGKGRAGTMESNKLNQVFITFGFSQRRNNVAVCACACACACDVTSGWESTFGGDSLCMRS